MDKLVKVKKEQQKQSGKFRKLHHFSVMKPFQLGKDNTIQQYPKSIDLLPSSMHSICFPKLITED